MRVLVVSLSDNVAWPVVRSLATAGCDPVVLGMRPLSPFSLLPECRGYAHFDEVRRTSSRRLDASMLTDVRRVCDQHRVELVMGADLLGVALLAADPQPEGWGDTALAAVPPTELLEELHDKWRFSLRLSALGLPQPRTELATTIEDVRAFGGRFPIVVKPRTMSNGAGMRVPHGVADVGPPPVSSVGTVPGVRFVVVQEHFGDWDIGYSFL